MAMKLLTKDRGPQGYNLCALLDSERLVPDPTLPAPVADEDGVTPEDTRPLVPDPDWCIERTWGPFVSGQKAHGGAGAPTVTKAMYLAQIKDEFHRLCLLALAEKQAAAAEPAVPDVGTWQDF